MSGAPRPGGRLPTAADGVAFVVIVGLACHLGFSWMGFNPTDEGFYLAAARRLLDGQIPHRDFITIRPAGASLMFAPIAAITGDYVFWVTRAVVWCEHATIAWLWATLVLATGGRQCGRVERASWALLVFVLTVGRYPIYVTSTVEAFFLVTAGVALVVTGKGSLTLIGYLLIGLSAVCRQNVLLVIPTVILAMGHWRDWRIWMSAFAGPALYVAWIATAGGATDLITQLQSRTNLLDVGVVPYASSPWFWGGLALAGVASLALSPLSGNMNAAAKPLKRLVLVVPAGAFVVSYAGLLFNGHHHLPSFVESSFWVFGMSAAITANALWVGRAGTGQLGIIALVLAWSLSISLGLNSPALMSGALSLLVVMAMDGVPNSVGWAAIRISRRFYALPIAAGLAVSVLVHVRRGAITVDAPAAELTAPVARGFSGARLLRTDPNTEAVIADFLLAKAKVRTPEFAIVPDFAAYWVAAPELNPLPIDWVWDGEITQAATLDRVWRTLQGRRGRLTIIVSKVWTASLRYGFEPVQPWASKVLNGVQATYHRTAETRYFVLYQ